MGLTQSQSEEIETKYINYYEVMGVSPQATDQQIKQQYQELSKSHHPDKQLDRSNPGSCPRTPALGNSAASDPLQSSAGFNTSNGSQLPILSVSNTSDISQSTLNEAWKSLSDPISRALYNAASGYAGPKEEEFQRYHALKMKHSQERIREYTEDYFAKYREWVTEYNKKRQIPSNFPKLFILQALYGDVVPSNRPALFTTPGKTIDVTMILRKMASDYALEIQTPRPYLLPDSFSYIDGFYDPNYENPDYAGNTVLYVRYLYCGQLYEEYIPDGQEMVVLPHESHRIEDDDDRGYYHERERDHAYPRDVMDELEETEQPYIDPDVLALIANNYSPSTKTQPILLSTKSIINDRILQDEEEQRDKENNNNNHNSPRNNNNNNEENNSNNIDDVSSPYHIQHSNKSTKSHSLYDLTQQLDTTKVDQYTLSDLPPHLYDQKLYYAGAIPMARHVWEVKMKPVKAKRRRTLYAALTVLCSTILGCLQWAGVIDMFLWPTNVQNRSVQLINYVKAQTKAKNTTEQNDI